MSSASKIYSDFFKSSEAATKGTRFQDLKDFSAALRGSGNGMDCAKALQNLYVAEANKSSKLAVEARVALIRRGLKLGRYLKLLGYFHEAIATLEAAFKLHRRSDGSEVLELGLVVLTEVICAANHAYDVATASKYVERGESMVTSTSRVMRDAELSFRAEKASFLLDSGKYQQAYALVYIVLRNMNEANLSTYSGVEVLFHAAKICRRHVDFEMAANLLQASVKLASEFYDHSSIITSAVLTELPWLLHDADLHEEAVAAQKSILQRREAEVGHNNAIIGVCYTDLSCYEYAAACNTGKFEETMPSVENAVKVFESPNAAQYGVLKARAIRQKAIIMRALAQQTEDAEERGKKSSEAHRLALACKDLCFAKVGDTHFQTAACYSLLGDSLAAMERFADAEKMHLKATKVLAVALGPNHQNYANANNNLAALYTYNLQQFEKAEPLYKLVISIYKDTIGPSCTNLQYPYRALLYIYSSTNRDQLAHQYDQLLCDWQNLQDQKKNDTSKKAVRCLTALLSPDLSKIMGSKEALERFVTSATKPKEKELEGLN